MQRGRLVLAFAVFGVLASGIVLLASPAAPLVAATKNTISVSNQQLSRRSLEFLVPRNLPIKIRLTPEKEQSFSDLKNENWIHDFELEVKNTGTKPIYYLRFTLNPDLSTPRGERSIGLMVQYGRAELFYRDEPSIPEDIPIQPNQTVVLKVFEDEAKGWDLWVKARHLSGEKSKPQKSMLLFEMLNFGDGTGYISSEEEPFSVPKRDKPRPSYKQNPGPVN